MILYSTAYSIIVIIQHRVLGLLLPFGKSFSDRTAILHCTSLDVSFGAGMLEAVKS